MTNGEIFDFRTKIIQRNLLSKKPDLVSENILIENITSLKTTPVVEQWRNFFLSDFSSGFLNRIACDIFGRSWQYILGDYYMFISPVGGENDIPYYKVSLFSRQRDAKLKSYLSVITSRHFYNKKQRESKKSNTQISLDEETRLVFTTDYYSIFYR